MQIREEPCAAKELIVVAGTRSVSGYPAPTGTIISAFNSCKVPVPLLANGTFIMDFSDSHSFDINDEDIKVKLLSIIGSKVCSSVTYRLYDNTHETTIYLLISYFIKTNFINR